MRKVLITCAITGAETTRQHNPNLPLTPHEIADAAVDAREAGASILHLHVRDVEGNPTQSPEVYRQTMELVRAKTDIVIEVTTGGASWMSLDERMLPLSLDPEMASLDCGTMNFGDETIVNTLPMIRQCAAEMKARNIRPTIEVFDLSHIDASVRIMEEKLIEEPLHYGIILNVPGGVRYDVSTLDFFARRLPAGAKWTVAGIGGRASVPSILSALAMGGNIRVGFEDNVYYEKGVLAASNGQLVERAARLVADAGFSPATPDDVRAMLKIYK